MSPSRCPLAVYKEWFNLCWVQTTIRLTFHQTNTIYRNKYMNALGAQTETRTAIPFSLAEL